MKVLLAMVATVALLLSCDARVESAATTDAAPHSFEHHECAACGMIVRDQPAPRGQIVHRDGTRVFFCSVSDMLSYADVPSPHGKSVASYVESNDAAADPNEFGMRPRPWIDAISASFVTGVDNPLVMGMPILVFESQEDATTVAAKVAGHVHDWTSVRVANTKRQEK